jgi:hypothetical protein
MGLQSRASDVPLFVTEQRRESLPQDHRLDGQIKTIPFPEGGEPIRDDRSVEKMPGGIESAPLRHHAQEVAGLVVSFLLARR